MPRRRQEGKPAFLPDGTLACVMRFARRLRRSGMSNTIMFVHGAWVTPASWDQFKSFFEAKGYNCLAPAWPYLDRPVAELKKGIDPRFAEQTISTLVDHYAQKVE